MGQSPPTVRTSKARQLGGGAEFFSTHKPTAHAAHVACPGNLAALKPPLIAGKEVSQEIQFPDKNSDSHGR